MAAAYMMAFAAAGGGTPQGVPQPAPPPPAVLPAPPQQPAPSQQGLLEMTTATLPVESVPDAGMSSESVESRKAIATQWMIQIWPKLEDKWRQIDKHKNAVRFTI